MEGKAPERLHLRAMGFCGVDDSISPEFLIFISQHYPFVEWGVLFRPDLEGTPRYASRAWIERLCELQKYRREQATLANIAPQQPMRLAAHLCGSRCQEVLDGDWEFVAMLRGLGFGRVQINATKANNVFIDRDHIGTAIANIQKCMVNCPHVEHILQYNAETKCICDYFLLNPVENMSILYDSSCGLGIEMKDFPTPENKSILHGYAGGINPKNIAEILKKVETVSCGKPVWIDMESSLRMKVISDNGDINDVFSIDKCYSCITVGVELFGLQNI